VAGGAVISFFATNRVDSAISKCVVGDDDVTFGFSDDRLFYQAQRNWSDSRVFVRCKYLSLDYG
jgi:hypothetical protein